MEFVKSKGQNVIPHVIEVDKSKDKISEAFKFLVIVHHVVLNYKGI